MEYSSNAVGARQQAEVSPCGAIRPCGLAVFMKRVTSVRYFRARGDRRICATAPSSALLSCATPPPRSDRRIAAALALHAAFCSADSCAQR